MNEYNARRKKEALPRIRAIRKLRKGGYPWNAIADMLGISRQRAQFLYQRNK